MWMPDVAGTDISPTRMPICCSMKRSDFMSDCAALNSFAASSLTNFTLRSDPRSTAGTAAAIRMLTTLVSAGDADSTGNGSTGAFGKASSATAVVSFERGGVTVTGADGGFGEGRGAGGASTTSGAALTFGFRGLSHLSQRIPCEIDEPHMKHF